MMDDYIQNCLYQIGDENAEDTGERSNDERLCIEEMRDILLSSA